MYGKQWWMIGCFLLAVLSVEAHAQNVVSDTVRLRDGQIRVLNERIVSDQIIPDTAIMQKQYDESNRFYRRLREKAENSRFARRMYKAFVSEDDRNYAPIDWETTLEKEITYFRQYEGQTINSVRIYRDNIFLGNYIKSDYRTIANSLHTITKERRIRQNLLFDVGDNLSAAVMAQNEQLLRNQDYLSDASIIVFESDSGEGVDIQVITRDSWSIGLTFRSVPEDRRYLDIYDDNFLGEGNRLDLRTYFSYKDKNNLYGGQMVEYTATNFFGSFFRLNALVGWGFDERRFGMGINKDFILSSDYMAGLAAGDDKYYDPQMGQDTSILVRRQYLDLWAGKSWNFPAVKSSYYLSGRYNDINYQGRPDVRPDSNSFYHDRRELLLSTGIYRETYYRGNMIYGFGRTELIPYGHRFEVTSGYSWGEFEDQWYTGVNAVVGRQNRWGYARSEITAGTYWDADGDMSRTQLSVKLDGFSNLWKWNRNYIRHFFRARYMQGWNRLKGEGEILSLWEDSSLQGVRRKGVNGRTRLILNTETVVFTPIYFYGFRFVFFGFGDFGWIGDNRRVFKNDFCTSLGIGVRLKNERLNFTTIQLRLGFGFTDHGAVDDYRHLRYSSESRFRVPPFKAEKPEIYPFR